MFNDGSKQHNPLRTGIFGIAITSCLVLVSFSYTELPFYPRGAKYTAYFANAAGVEVGNDTQIYGFTVGKVTDVDLDTSIRAARVTFTVDRDIPLGDQTLVAIKTDTVLGQRALAVTPRGTGRTESVPLGRTTTPYTLSNALQDLGHTAGEVDTDGLVTALDTLTGAMKDATPQLRGALDGITELSRTVNQRDERLESLLLHANSVSSVVATRAEQMNQLIIDGTQLFRELDARRQAISTLITGIGDVSREITGFVTDNRREFGPALQRLNLVLDNLNERREHISEAIAHLPAYATALGEVVGSGPGFGVNVYGVPPPSAAAMLLDSYFQPGKVPDALADFLRGTLVDRVEVRPKSP